MGHDAIETKATQGRTRDMTQRHVVGLCRFSYPAVGGFQRMHDSTEEREAYLYAPTRMAQRFAHFEALTLPSVAAQSDPDFSFVVLIGDSLPAPYLDRLRDITADIPQVRLFSLPPRRARRAAQHAIVAELARLGADRESIQFRLDDDDAVAVDFVERCRALADRSEALRDGVRCFGIEFPRGLTVSLSPGGVLAEELTASFWACGMAMVIRAGDDKTIMNFPHHKMHHTVPMLVEPRPEMFIRAKHDDNDSGKHYRTGELRPLTDDQRKRLKWRFALDEDRIRRIFSAAAASPGKA
ncbi:glycosyltransferase [Marimonas lutisalis]|uniref:glycosyltransferase n=1 Tax=Marimonas lutisalis TaxID=2545756 RepID=UPI001F34FAAF|nr:glycosyltransferase [Marimonas lutisalis]